MLGQILEPGCVEKLDHLAGGDRASPRQSRGVDEAGAGKVGRCGIEPDRHKQGPTRFQCLEDLVNAVEERLPGNESLRHPRQVVGSTDTGPAIA